MKTNKVYTDQFYKQDQSPDSDQQDQSQSQITKGESGSMSPKSSAGQAPSINLPTGGGAINSIGEKFEANPVTGTGNASVPLPISPGRQGFAPQLTLSYDSGSGSGAFGLGWNVGLPSITRKTQKGLPLYEDLNESDTFILSGAEDLVPVFEESGNDWIRKVDESSSISHIIYQYRPRTEGLFARIERWMDRSTGQSHWRATTKDNITSVYGESSQGRIVDPKDPQKIFQWLIERSWDNKGNLIRYTYKAENTDNVPACIYEQHRLSDTNSFTNRYLKRVSYGNTTPWKESDGAFMGSYLFELVFDYGEHDVTNPTWAQPNLWDYRMDAFSNFRSGFEVRTNRLCKRVMMFHNFDALKQAPGDNPVLVKEVKLNYEHQFEFSLLKNVVLTGYGENNEIKSYPPLEFSYSDALMENEVFSISPESLENLPASAQASGFQWADLNGEGISGLLYQDKGSWYYKENHGDARYYDNQKENPELLLAPVRLLSESPSMNNSTLSLADLDGNGQSDVTIRQPGLFGFYEMSEEGKWEAFQTFKHYPNIDFNDPNLRMIDLNGDGHADILITGQDCFTIYESKAKQGYAPAKKLSKAFNENQGPAIVFSDPDESIFLADMTGDGLSDIVRINNGAIDYWPNMGYGYFGTKVSMSKAPRFDKPDMFHASRIRLADVDGTGTADVIYLSSKTAWYWKNQAGNSWSSKNEIKGFPGMDSITDVWVADLFGNGTQCLAWASSAPNQRGHHMKYIQLTGGKKPFLLTQINNNMGGVRTMHYAPSTKFYLKDKKSDNPWITKLPFPVQVLEKIEIHDEPTGAKYVSRYGYHHGYFDGQEREFRGFGMVEQWDTEDFDVNLSNNTYPINEIPEVGDLPPVLTRTWFHTGFYTESGKITRQYEDEYYSADSNAWLLADTILPDGLTTEEQRQASRALKGSVLRQEVYGLDGSYAQVHPYSVEEKSYTLTMLQGQLGNKHAVFHVTDSEGISYHYERASSNPRIQHQLVLEKDEYGNICKSATVFYKIRQSNSDHPEWDETFVKYDEISYINTDSNLLYRLGVSKEQKSYQIHNLAENGKYEPESLLTAIASAQQIDYSQTPSTMLEKRLLSDQKVLYYDESCTQALSFGQVASHGLPYQTKALAFTDSLIDQILAKNTEGGTTANVQLPDKTAYRNALITEGKYVLDAVDNSLWTVSERMEYDVLHFYTPTKYIDPFLNQTLLGYDPHFLLMEDITDAEGNITEAVYNYRFLQPQYLYDVNSNTNAVDFDALGMVIASAVWGTAGEGDDLSDPTMQMSYDLDCWMNQQKPVYVHTMARTTHGDVNTSWLESYTYSNGLGQELMTKVQAEDGPAWQLDANGLPEQVTNCTTRWVATGKTVRNNKAKVIKQYEPWFSTHSDYEDETALTQYGVSPLMHYDPLGRVIRTDYPDGTYSDVDFDAWRQHNWDQNDRVVYSDWFISGGYPNYWHNTPEPTDDEMYAGWMASKLSKTPQSQYLDAMGRVCLTVDMNFSEKVETRQKYDLGGNVLMVTDALNRQITHNLYNCLGQLVYTENIDSGKRWMTTDVMGKPISSWNHRDHIQTYSYDTLLRPTSIVLNENDGQGDKMVEMMVYGSSAMNNSKGKLITHYDQSGKVQVNDYDFKGNVLSVSRQLASDYINTLRSPTATLETEVFTTVFSYDAMNRPVQINNPLNYVANYSYNKAGLLESVGSTKNGIAVGGISNINYNEKGQRQAVYYNNNTKTRYDYDPLTFRLKRLLTTRNNGVDILQDLNYYYDPVGNITSVVDNAQQTHYFNNTQIDPKTRYYYDTLYRVTKAKGRELASLAMPTDTDFVDNIPLPNPASNAMQNYTQEFSYDKIGNMQQMSSQGQWTRNYYYNTADNYLLGHTSGTTEYTYDSHGNMLSMPHLSQMGWDYQDLLHKTVKATVPTYYTYDSGGERTRKVTLKPGNIREERIYLGEVELYRKYVNDVLDFERESVSLSDDQDKFLISETKTVENGSTITTPVSTIRYQYTNHLGSASLELDHTASIISYEEYHPFGTTSYRSGRTETECSQKRYKYCGKEKDEESGLYYYGARYYAQWICRFVSVDPLQHDYPQLTPFQYAGNKPATYVDIDGLEAEGDEKVNSESTKFLEIKKGDTFWEIERELGVKSGTLQKLNPSVDPTRLSVGQVVRVAADVSGREIRNIDDTDIGIVNYGFSAISVSGEFVLHPIIEGENAGSWLVRRYYEGGQFQNLLVGGSGAFRDLINENFEAPARYTPVEELDIQPTMIRHRTAMEIFKEYTDEEGAMNDALNDFTPRTIGTFMLKRLLNQFSNPMNYLRIMAGSPQAFKNNYKPTVSGFNSYKANNSCPPRRTFYISSKRYRGAKNKRIAAKNKRLEEQYNRRIDLKNNLGNRYNMRFDITVSSLKTINSILDKHN